MERCFRTENSETVAGEVSTAHTLAAAAAVGDDG